MSLNLTIVNSSTPSGMSDFQVISSIIALCALVLGIANAYFHWKDKQPNIKVDAYEFVDSAHSLTSDPERVITIRGYNSGQIPITISSYSFFIPSKKIGHSIGKPYSTRVLPGAYCERWEYSDKIARVLQPRSRTIKIIACLIDESGKWYKSVTIQPALHVKSLKRGTIFSAVRLSLQIVLISVIKNINFIAIHREGLCKK